MRNFYLYEPALRVNSVPALEEGLNILNSIFVNRDQERDCFLCNGTIWECDTTQGRIYEMYNGVVNAELQRLIPILFNSFINHDNIYNNHNEIDVDFPEDCNAFTGFEFGHTTIHADRRVFNTNTYDEFVESCLKHGTINDDTQMRENLSILYPDYVFSEQAVEDTLFWKNENKAFYERIFTLFDDIPQNPFTGGIGETEVLKYKKDMASKRINHTHRVTYNLKNGIIEIYGCKGHYD